MGIGFFIIHFLGCVFQAGPIAFLIFRPFDRSELKIWGKRLTALLLTVLVMYGCIFALYVDIIFPVLSPETVQVRANMATFAALVAGSVFAFWNIKASMVKKVFVLLIDVYYATLIYTFSSFIMNQLLFSWDTSVAPYSIYNIFTLAFLELVTMPFMWHIMSVNMKNFIGFIDHHQIFRSCIYIGIELLLFSVFIFAMPEFDTIHVVIIVVCYGVSNVLALFSFISEVNTIKQQYQMEERLRSIDVEYASIQAGIEEMVRLRHDMRHHLSIIGTLNAEERYEELTQYLKQYTQVYESFENEKLSDDSRLNTILKYYLERCRQKNIRVNTCVQLRDPLTLDFTDMTVLLGNCLENAINACLLIPVEQRYIQIKIVQVRRMLLIYVENSCDSTKSASSQSQSPDTEPKEPVLGKKRGYGLGSIRRIAVKYDGSAEFSQENHRFCTRIVLNLYAMTK